MKYQLLYLTLHNWVYVEDYLLEEQKRRPMIPPYRSRERETTDLPRLQIGFWREDPNREYSATTMGRPASDIWEYHHCGAVDNKTLQRVLLAVETILIPQLYHGIYHDNR